MKLQEIYKNQIINNLKVVNVVLGLSAIGNPSIQEFLEASKKSYKHICKSKANKNKSVKMLMELCSDIMVISEDCCFYNIPILDFKSYSRPDQILDFVLKFSSQDRMVEFINKDYKYFIAFIIKVENSLGSNIRDSLSYIVMRNFLMFCELGMYRFAYYYACFIRTQIFISEGLNPRVEYSDLFKSELSLAIRKEQKKYAKGIENKVKSVVVGALSKVPLVDEDKLSKKLDRKFVGESLQTTIGSDSSESIESVKNSVDNIIDQRRKDNEIGTIKDVVKDKSNKVVNDVKTGTKEGAKAVAKGTARATKTVVKAASDPVVKAVKEKAINPMKNKIEEALDIAPNKDIDDFIDNMYNISESDIIDHVSGSKRGYKSGEEPSKDVKPRNEEPRDKETVHKEKVVNNVVNNVASEEETVHKEPIYEEPVYEAPKVNHKENVSKSSTGKYDKYDSYDKYESYDEDDYDVVEDKYDSYDDDSYEDDSYDDSYDDSPSDSNKKSKFDKLNKNKGLNSSSKFKEDNPSRKSKFDKLSSSKNTKDKGASGGTFSKSSIF